MVCAVHDTVDDECRWRTRSRRGRAGVPWSQIAVWSVDVRSSSSSRRRCAARAFPAGSSVSAGCSFSRTWPMWWRRCACWWMRPPATPRCASLPGPDGGSASRPRRPGSACPAARGSAADGRPCSGHCDPEPDVVDERSLVDALDDLGEPGALLRGGHRRLRSLRDELRRLRRASAQPLPDLVVEVARTLYLDVEMAARPGVRAVDALVHVDRLVEVAEDFVASGEDPGVMAFLGYLDAAEEQGAVWSRTSPSRTANARCCSPFMPRRGWVRRRGRCRPDPVRLPDRGSASGGLEQADRGAAVPLRGDRAELPTLDVTGVSDQKEDRCGHPVPGRVQETRRRRGAAAGLRRHHPGPHRAAVQQLLVGQRCATARPVGTASCPDRCAGRGPGGRHEAARRRRGQPLTLRRRSASWPRDPLDGRRDAVERGAAMVRAGVRHDPRHRGGAALGR